MTNCALCEYQFIQAYQHLEYRILICKLCYQKVKMSKMSKHYAYFSLLKSPISKKHKQAHKKLKQCIKNRQQSIENLLMKGVVQHCFQPVQIIEKSDRGSLATEDTEAFNEMIARSDKNTSDIVRQKYQQTVTALASRIQPTKQKLMQHGQALLQKTQPMRQKYRAFRGEFRSIKAELPPMNELANEAKQKLSNFFKLF